ncbi:MAG TPA: helicase-associated domain-containing protein [Anaerolineales bacterium]
MPDLAESLQGRDLGHLCIIAELWGLEIAEQEPQEVLRRLTTALSDPGRVERMVSSLPAEVKEALDDLVQHAGRLPWAQFTRTYGELREMGVAKRDREQPHKQPISSVEALWYRGFLAMAFFDSPTGPQEFAYIPDDVLKCIPQAAAMDTLPLGRRAAALEYAVVSLANDRILDHACTLLAALRQGIPLGSPFTTQAGEELTPRVLAFLLSASGLMDEAGMPAPEPVGQFLESPRGEALLRLTRSWQHSTNFNELSLLPTLSFEGNWLNDPLHTRQAVLGYLKTIPTDTWWNLDSFIAAIKQRNPDFQRPAGDYDSWFIRDETTGQYLRGFDHWDEVDGRLIRYIFNGLLHWLGILDLAGSGSNQDVTAFRLSAWSRALLNDRVPKGIPAEEEPLIARSDARISARRLVPRRVRYQLARFCDWEKETPDEYLYQVSVGSLTRARQQGLTVSQLLALLNRHSQAVPPSLLKALERWDKQGSEARLEKLVILRVTSAEVLQALRKSRASRFLGEPLSLTTIAIKPGATQKVLAALAELGYLGEIRGEAG